MMRSFWFGSSCTYFKEAWLEFSAIFIFFCVAASQLKMLKLLFDKQVSYFSFAVTVCFGLFLLLTFGSLLFFVCLAVCFCQFRKISNTAYWAKQWIHLTGYGAYKAYLWVYECIFSLHKVANRHASGVWHGRSLSVSCHLMATACVSYLLLVKWVKAEPA